MALKRILKIVANSLLALSGLEILLFLLNLAGWVGTALNWWEGIPSLWIGLAVLVPIGVGLILLLASKRLEMGLQHTKTTVLFPDMRAHDAVQYVLTQTNFGPGKTEHDVTRALREAARDDRIRVWGYQGLNLSDKEIIPPEAFKDHLFKLERGASGGYVCDRRGITTGTTWIGPMVCKEQIESIWQH